MGGGRQEEGAEALQIIARGSSGYDYLHAFEPGGLALAGSL